MLSICMTVKNRSRVEVDGRELLLLPNCIRSIAEALPADVPAELVLTDWGSDDWPPAEWLPDVAGDLPFRIVDLEGTFSRGKGLNVAARKARGDVLAFLDADLLVSSDVFRKGLDAVAAGKIFFPVFFAFDTPEHEDGTWRDTSFGNCMLSREVFDAARGWPEYQSWGEEDNLFHAKTSSLAPVERERLEGLRHQWHPNEIVWKNRFGEPTFREEENAERIHEIQVERIERTRERLAELLPPGSTAILIDDGRFGADPVPGVVCRPFLEKDGHYYGAPPDDRTAIEELDRMRGEGCRFVVFVWAAFWWIYFYPELVDRLREGAPCVVEDDDVMIFDLAGEGAGQ